MSSFQLPSGRSVDIHDPTYGEEMDLAIAAPDDVREIIFAKFALVVPELSRDDVRNLTRADGHALQAEVTRVWDGVPQPPLRPQRKRRG